MSPKDDDFLRPIGDEPGDKARVSRLDREIERLRTSPTPGQGSATARTPLSSANAFVSGVPWMGIFSRTRDIIAANFNELLDQADDPAKMIRMIILEMEETLVEVRASAARTIADQKEMHRHTVKIDKLALSEADEKIGNTLHRERRG